MIALESRPDGIVLPVRARAGGRQNGIQGAHDGLLKISVTIAPEKGKANQAIENVLCKELGLRKAQVDLIAGSTSPRKRFLISEISIEELQERMEKALKAG